MLEFKNRVDIKFGTSFYVLTNVSANGYEIWPISFFIATWKHLFFLCFVLYNVAVDFSLLLRQIVRLWVHGFKFNIFRLDFCLFLNSLISLDKTIDFLTHCLPFVFPFSAFTHITQIFIQTSLVAFYKGVVFFALHVPIKRHLSPAEELLPSRHVKSEFEFHIAWESHKVVQIVRCINSSVRSVGAKSDGLNQMSAL